MPSLPTASAVPFINAPPTIVAKKKTMRNSIYKVVLFHFTSRITKFYLYHVVDVADCWGFFLRVLHFVIYHKYILVKKPKQYKFHMTVIHDKDINYVLSVKNQDFRELYRWYASRWALDKKTTENSKFESSLNLLLLTGGMVSFTLPVTTNVTILISFILS